MFETEKRHYENISYFLNKVNEECNKHSFYKNGFFLKDLTKKEKENVLKVLFTPAIILSNRYLAQSSALLYRHIYLFDNHHKIPENSIMCFCNEGQDGNFSFNLFGFMKLFYLFQYESKYAKIFIIILDLYIDLINKHKPFVLDDEFKEKTNQLINHWQLQIYIEMIKDL